ncbi:hypothetical protein J2128_000084 [Methanomicrobium sp. W14]|uniref:hypothetical protein n=1 Tax=Methanomicrobium sp. W14 TaxID=2817839 RepID=UPI001AE6ED3F|nr:hypothetical protein [Methanomicrobium sp. W14]MBP2132163.1 hypothetical protein [Methanomicrobium sp. W14]
MSEWAGCMESQNLQPPVGDFPGILSGSYIRLAGCFFSPREEFAPVVREIGLIQIVKIIDEMIYGRALLFAWRILRNCEGANV